MIEVPNEAECKIAAKNLGLSYKQVENENGGFPACYIDEVDVKFNKNPNPDRSPCGSNSFCRNIEAICKGVMQ